jgi:hypothetical protein
MVCAHEREKLTQIAFQYPFFTFLVVTRYLLEYEVP